MKVLTKIQSIFFLVLVISPILLNSQSFEKKVLINVPGDNFDFDLLANESSLGAKSFITWINRNDSVYTVFLKRISPDISDINIVISSDINPKSNPNIARNRYAQGIKIVWQNYSNNYFQIVGCNYLSESLSNEIVIEDSLTVEPLISLSTHRVAWINDNKLFIKEFYPSLGTSILVDSLNCTSPNIQEEDAIAYTQILYERVENESHQVYLASFNDYSNPKWTYYMISDGINKNPNFGINGGVSFETIENNISRIKYTAYGIGHFSITENRSCNYKNPFVFSYPIPVSLSNDKTPFFVAFDTDSLDSNNEVFIKPFYNNLNDSLINISNMAGNDFMPKLAYLVNDDTVYVTIIWIHQNSSNTNIWIAKEVFNPINTFIGDKSINTKSFDLFQNYPNPFYQYTNIEYLLEHDSNVEIGIFDFLGNHIVTLVDGYRTSGMHKVLFNANNLCSGVYFYTIRNQEKQITKSMILLK